MALSTCSRVPWPAHGPGRLAPPTRGEGALGLRPPHRASAFASFRRERDPVIRARSAWLAYLASPADSGPDPDLGA